MEEEKFGVKEGEHVPAKKVLEYLKAMIEEGGVSQCLRLNTQVDIVEQTPNGWRLQCSSTAAGTSG